MAKIAIISGPQSTAIARGTTPAPPDVLLPQDDVRSRTPAVPLPGTTLCRSRLAGTMRRTLIVTNDFPPRQGGIQSFVHELALRLDPGDLTVYAPKWEGAPEFDARQPFEVVRHPTSLMIGGPSVTRRAAELARSRKAEVVIFGAAAPLGPDHPGAAPRRRAAGDRDHPRPRSGLGGPARSPGACCAGSASEPTSSPTWASTSGSGSPGRSPPTRPRGMTQLHPGVDAAAFRPDPAARGGDQGPLRPRRPPGRGLRVPPGPPQGPGHAAARLARGPRGRSRTRRCSSSAAGPYGQDLTQLAERTGADCLRPLHRPGPAGRAARRTTRRATSSRCRAAPGVAASTWRASASSTWRRPRPGLPVVGGDSGGAPDAILEGETGYVVGGRDVTALSDRLVALLADPERGPGDGGEGPRLGRARLVLGPDRHPPRASSTPSAPPGRPAPSNVPSAHLGRPE